MATWTFVLRSASGNSLCEFSEGSDVKFRFRRNDWASCELTVSTKSEQFGLAHNELLLSGTPQLVCWRREDGTNVNRFSGWLASVKASGDANESLCTLTFHDPFYQLEERFTTGGDAGVVEFSAVAQGTIIKSLIDTADGVADVGITTDTANIVAGKVRDRTFEFKQVAEAVRQLTEVLDGPDFWIEPQSDGATLGSLHVYAEQGEEKANAALQYGHATLTNCSGYELAYLPPRNQVTVLGADSVSHTETNSTSVTKYRLHEFQENASDVIEADTLEEKAHDLIRTGWVAVVSMTPELGLDNCPRFFDDYFLGDTLPVYVRDGNLELSGQMRVNEVELLVDESGNETHSIGRDDPDARRTADVSGEVV